MALSRDQLRDNAAERLGLETRTGGDATAAALFLGLTDIAIAIEGLGGKLGRLQPIASAQSTMAAQQTLMAEHFTKALDRMAISISELANAVTHHE